MKYREKEKEENSEILTSVGKSQKFYLTKRNNIMMTMMTKLCFVCLAQFGLEISG